MEIGQKREAPRASLDEFPSQSQSIRQGKVNVSRNIFIDCCESADMLARMNAKLTLFPSSKFLRLAGVFAAAWSLSGFSALATDFTWITSGGGTWTANSANRLTYYGTPTPTSAGPQGTDNLTFTANGTQALQNSSGELTGGNDREIDNLASTVAGANISSGNASSGGFTSLTIHGDLNLSGADSSLTFYNIRGNPVGTAAMTATVEGNVNIGAGTSLYLGLIQDTGTPSGGNDYSSYLNGFTANSTTGTNGQVNVDGKLMLNRNTTTVTLGDVDVGSAGVVTLTGAGTSDLAHSGTFNKTIQARSLAGSGIVENSLITGTEGDTSSTATLALNTLASTDATFSGVLRDGSGTDATLNLTVSGSGQQTLTGDNTYSGTTLVSAGTLLIDGAQSGTGLVTVESGGTLGGNGSIAGSLSLLAGADFVFSLTDTLTVNGDDVSFGGFGIGNLIGLDDSVALGTYTLIDGTATFDFANVTDIGSGNAVSIGGGKSAYLQEGSLQVVVVPEPTALALLVGGLAFTLLGRRRRS